MFNRFLSMAFLVYLAAISVAFGQASNNNQGLSFLFQLPGGAATNGQFLGYLDNSNPLNSIFTLNGPAGLTRIIPKPDGSKFFMVGTGAVESIDGAFSTAPQIVTGLAGPPQAVKMTPDGKYLLVGASDQNNNGFLYIVSTTTNQIVGAGIPLASNPTFIAGTTTQFCPQCFIAVSQDSTTAWVLTNSGSSSRITQINITQGTATAPYVLPFGDATSITMSPLGLLYVTAVNVIYEFTTSPLALTANGQIQLFFSPYLLHFTPDGSTAYAVNLAPSSGGSVLSLNIATHGVQTWPSFQSGITPVTFNDVIIAGNSRVFLTDSAQSTLAEINTGAFPAATSVAPSVLSIGQNSSLLSVETAAVSNELPNAQFLFMLVASGGQANLYRMTLATNTVSTENQLATNLPVLQVASVPNQTGAASFLTYSNTNQVLATGGASMPLSARVLDGNGLPLYNDPVSFTAPTGSGVTITNASTVTNAEGFVTANASVPNTPGTYNVILNAGGGVTQVFALTVPGAGGVIGGGSGTSSQVTIASGDGQIVFPDGIFQVTTYPLTILVTDTSGKPLPNVPVTFTLTSGSGFIQNPNTATDANGNASTFFVGAQLAVNTTVQPNIIAASTPVGSVNFTVTTFLLNGDSTGLPQTTLINPNAQNNFTVTVPEGTPVPNAIEAQILAVNFPLPPPSPAFPNPPAVPGIGIFLTAPSVADGLLPPITNVASCQGSSNSDANGIAHCTLVAACGQIGSQAIGVSFGGGILAQNVQLNIIAGGASQFNIVSGNNQSGTAGQTISGLSATLTDGCGVPAANTNVVWAVASGSATLVNTSSTTNGNGSVSTGVKLGQTPGVVTITVTAGSLVGTFTLKNNVIVAGVFAVSGGAQAAQVGAQFSSPLIVVVKDNNGNVLPNIAVTFSVTAGIASVSPASTNTGTNGQAQTVVTAGNTAGSIVVTASAAGFSTTFALTSQLAGPAITSTSFVNAYSQAVGLVPCGLSTVTGSGIAPGVSGTLSGPTFGQLPTNLGGFSMTIDGVLAPIQSVSNQNGVQAATFQTPCETPIGVAIVVVTVNGSATPVQNVPVLQVQPGILTFPGTNGKTYGVVLRALDGSEVTQTNFAHRGETYYLVVTGLNQTLPATATNDAGIPNQNVAFGVQNMIVGINNLGVPVVSAQYEQGAIGVYLVGFQIPLTATTGPDQNLAVAVLINGSYVFGLGPTNILIPGVQ